MIADFGGEKAIQRDLDIWGNHMGVACLWGEEVLRQLDEADQDELREMLEEAGDEAVEEIQGWVRAGNVQKGLFDAFMRFTRNPHQCL